MLRFLKYIAEALAAFIGVVVILSMLLAWRLSEKPVASDFLTPYIATAIQEIIPGSSVDVASTLLTWDSADKSISVEATDIKIKDAQGGAIADIPSLHASISVIGLLFGQFMPSELVIDHPQFKLAREPHGNFVFGGMSVGAKTSPNTDSGKPIDEILGNALDHLTHTILMRHLDVTRAVFDVHDEGTQKDWAVSVPEISIKRTGLRQIHNRLEFGDLEGHIIIDVTQRDGTASLDVLYLYDNQKKTHTLATSFSDLDPAYLAGGHPETLGLNAAKMVDLPLTGKIEVELDKSISFATASAHIHGDAGHIVYPDYWDAPLNISSFDFNADYDRDNHSLTVSDTHADLDGITMDLDVTGAPPTQAGQDLDFSASLRVDHMPMNKYSDLWPKPILPDPRYWLVANLRDGMFDHADVNLTGSLAWNDLANLSINDGSGKLAASGGRVTYLDGMPPAENVNADATFDLKKMDVQINSGGIGNIRLQPFKLEITGLADVDQAIHIPLQVTGPLPDVLALLDHQPLGYAKKLGIAPSDIQGKIAGSVDFKFPLLKTLDMKDLDIHASADATDVATTKLVPGVAIDQGNLALTLDMTGFGLTGQADLNKVPFQITLQQSFETQAGKPLRHVTVTGPVKDNQWDNFGINVFDGSKGAMNLTLDITNPTKNKVIFVGTVDMTPSTLAVDMLGWKKAANQPATLKFTATQPTGGNVTVTSIDLRGDHVKAIGTAKLTPDMKRFLSVDLSPFVIGRTNARLHFEQGINPTDAIAFAVSGPSLDISGFRNDQAADENEPISKQYTIEVDKLYNSATGEIDNAKGFALRDAQGWNSISLHGLADGDTPLGIDLTPQPDGHRTLLITCNDFGKTMKGLGFTDKVKGGKLVVDGQSTVDAPRLITGHIKISDFSVERLPVLMQLLNTLSPFGFVGLLTDRTDFSRFEADYNLQGDTLDLTRAHAAGSAVGINVDGKIDIDSANANLQGTVVPFSTVNKILNYIPLIGDLITGGQDQGVLAVTYQIKGSLDAPEISVNPVSLLTPGFIRNLFFRDDTLDDVKPTDTQ